MTGVQTCALPISVHLIINVDFSDKFKNLAENFRRANLIESLFVVNQAMKDLRRMRNAALVMEYAVLRLQRLSGIVD